MQPIPYAVIISDYLAKVHTGSPKRVLADLTNRLNFTALDYTGSTLDLRVAYYCYVYLDPRYPGDYTYVLPSGKVVSFKFKPFYVGKGKGNRVGAHQAAARKTCRSTPKLNLIRKLARLGLRPVIKVTQTLDTEASALAFEIDLIAGIGTKQTKQGPLTNLSAGGAGASGYRHTPEAIAKMSAAHKGKPHSPEHIAKLKKARARQKTMTEATRRKISEAARGRIPSASTRAKMSAAQKGKRIGMKHSLETRAKISASLQGRIHSEATKAKMRASHVGRKWSIQDYVSRGMTPPRSLT